MVPTTHADDPYVRSLLLQQVRLVTALKDIQSSLADIVAAADADLGNRLMAVQQIASSALEIDNRWSVFSHRHTLFDGSYLAALANDYPSLTATELRLCAFLRLSMPSKDIAMMLNCSVRSIEKHRERIRKKLQLENGANLNTFLASRGTDASR